MIPPRPAKPVPFYSADGITIYHGDSHVILPKLGLFDLLLTDPPYGIGEARSNNKSRSKLASAKDYGAAEWDDNPPDDSHLNMCRASSFNQIIFGGNYFNLPPSRCWLLWDKENGASDFADAEMAWTNLNMAVRLKRYRWTGMLQGNMKEKEFRYHPTQKPVPVMEWCLNFLPDCKTVIDPFMGAGTTLVACKNLGRQCVGIERELQYCKIAVDRLAQLTLL